jgi:hypothetical protein
VRPANWSSQSDMRASNMTPILSGRRDHHSFHHRAHEKGNTYICVQPTSN